MPDFKVYGHRVKADGSIDPEEIMLAGPFFEHAKAEEMAIALASTGKWAKFEIR